MIEGKFLKNLKCFKEARIIPLFKSGDKTLAENYRPISLLPQISKIFRN